MWTVGPDLHYSVKILVFTVFIISHLIQVLEATHGCGGFIEVSSSSVYTFGLPSYKSNDQCIWLIEADPQHLVNLKIKNFQGESVNGECRDYIKIYDGGLSENVIMDKTCGSLTNFVLNSTARWMLIQFRCDNENFTAAFVGEAKGVYTTKDLNSHHTPIAECKTHQTQCSNKICIERSYLCDGFLDCGCDNGCDEEGCSGIGLTRVEILGVGIGVGTVIFIFIFIAVHIFERRRKKKALMEEEETERQINKSKKGGKDKKDKDKKDTKGKKKRKVAPKEEKSTVHWVN